MNAPKQISQDFMFESFYVDDYIGGAVSEGDTLKLQKDLQARWHR